MRAYKCDLCGKFTEHARKVDGLDFKVGEYVNEFTGITDIDHGVHDLCKDCYGKIMKTVKSLYDHEN